MFCSDPACRPIRRMFFQRRGRWKELHPSLQRDFGGATRSYLNRPLEPGSVRCGDYMGRTQEAFGAELMAIRMGMRSMVARPTSGKDYTVFTDSQAAMVRAQNDRPGPGQQRAIEIVEAADTLVTRRDSISTSWVPGHRGVSDNEAAQCLYGSLCVIPKSNRRFSTPLVSLTTPMRSFCSFNRRLTIGI